MCLTFSFVINGFKHILNSLTIIYFTFVIFNQGIDVVSIILKLLLRL